MTRAPKSQLRQLTRLAEPFAPGLVQQKPGAFEASYVPHEIYLQKMLGVIGPHSFQVEELIYGANNVVEGCLAALTATIDGETQTVREVGDCENPSNWKTNGQRAKDAASDAYKRCCMRLCACGLHLWCKADKYILYQLLKTRDTQERGENGGQPAGKSAQPSASGSLTPANSGAAPTLPLPPCTDDVTLEPDETRPL